MTFCLNCQANVKKRKLRQCVRLGHHILWGTWKPHFPTYSNLVEVEERVKNENAKIPRKDFEKVIKILKEAGVMIRE